LGLGCTKGKGTQTGATIASQRFFAGLRLNARNLVLPPGVSFLFLSSSTLTRLFLFILLLYFTSWTEGRDRESIIFVNGAHGLVPLSTVAPPVPSPGSSFGVPSLRLLERHLVLDWKRDDELTKGQRNDKQSTSRERVTNREPQGPNSQRQTLFTQAWFGGC